MEKKEKKECWYFFSWGLGVLGFLGILACIVEVIRFFVFQKPILWDRVIIVLLLSIGLYLLGVKYTKKYG